MTDKTNGVLGHLASMALADGEKWESIHDKVAELLAADEEYDAAKAAAHIANDTTLEVKAMRLYEATRRRAAAIRAMRGEPPVG